MTMAMALTHDQLAFIKSHRLLYMYVYSRYGTEQHRNFPFAPPKLPHPASFVMAQGETPEKW